MANQLRPAEQHMDLCCMLCASLDGREVWGRTDTCICMTKSLHCSPEHITTLLIGYTPMQNVFGVKKLKFGGKKRSPAAKTFGTICPRFSCNYFNVGVTHTHTHTHIRVLSAFKVTAWAGGETGSGWLSSLPGVRTQSQNRRVS